jgi:FtsZ-binding cell division protein ZapB
MISGSYNKDNVRRNPERRTTMEDLKNQMDGITHLYQQLDQKISTNGGVQNLFGLNRKIREALETITIGELDSMLNEIHRAKESLTRLQEDVVEIRVLKEVLNSPTGRLTNGGSRL